MYKLKTRATIALLVAIITGALIYTESQAQAPPIDWKKSIGSSLNDKGNSCQQTFDGGFIFVGNTDSLADGNLTGTSPKGKTDIEVIKTSSTGAIQWKKRYGGSSTENATCVRQTADSGFIIVGSTKSNNKNVSGNHGGTDIWVVKLNPVGAIQWQKCLGGTSSEDAYSVIQTLDGGYIVAGFTTSSDSDATGLHGIYSDAFIAKLDSNGNKEWSKCYGGTQVEMAYSIVQTPDSNYTFAARTGSSDGDVSGHNPGALDDYWVVKIDQTGNILWDRCYGGSGYETAQCIQKTFDGGYIVGGYSPSNDGDVTGNHGTYDYWVVKIDAVGTLQWQKSYGGSASDFCKGVSQTADSGYIVIGSTYSTNGQVVGNHSANIDIWVLKINSIGTINWKKCFGGTTVDESTSPIWQTTDGGYVFCGNSNSTDGNVTGNHGGTDIWVVKLNPSTSRFGDDLAENDAGIIEIYDMLGNRVYWQNVTDRQQVLNIERLSAGMYFIKTSNSVQKIIKE